MPYFCVEKIAGALNEHSKPVRGSRIADPRRLVQAGRRRPARVARAQDHAAARASAAPRSAYHDPYVPELPELGLELASRSSAALDGVRLRGDRHRPPGPRLDQVVGQAPLVVDFRGVTRGIEAHPTWCGCDATASGSGWSASATGARTSPATSTACRAPSSRWICDADAGGARALDRAASPARAPPPTSTSCWPTTTLDAVVDRHAGAHARRSGPAGARGGQALLRREAARAVGRPRPSRSSPRRASAGRVLMVGHLLEYHPGVEKLKEIADAGELGDIHYIYSQPPQPRASCAPTRTRSGRSAPTTCPWCCGSAGEEPSEAQRVRRELHAARASRTSCSASCASPPALSAHLHLSWLDPHKERRFTVVGSKRMATFDDMDARAQGRRSTTRASTRTSRPTASTSRARATSTARGSRTRSRCGSSAGTSSSASRRAAEPRSGAESGLRVVRVLEALQTPRCGESAPCCNRLTARPACCWATASQMRRRRCRSAPTWSSTTARCSAPGCTMQDGAVLGKPRALGPQLDAPRGTSRRPLVVGGGRRSCARARSCSRGPGSGAARWWATRRRCASARGSARARWWAAAAQVDNDVVDRRARAGSRRAATSPRTPSSRTTCSWPRRVHLQRQHDGPPRPRRPRCVGADAAPRVPGGRRRAAPARASRSARRRSSRPARVVTRDVPAARS